MKSKIETILDWLAYIGLAVMGIAALAAVVVLILFGIVKFLEIISLRPADDLPPADTPSEGVAWVMPEAGEVPVWLSPVCAGEAERAVRLDHYTEGDGPAPEWWRPEEPMSAEWTAGVTDIYVGDKNVRDINVPCNAQQSDTVDYNPHPPIGIDPGGVDWNLCSIVWGWDGHGAEAWELDLYARIVYLEFWGTSPECCEAGADSILRLWDSGYFGDTLGGVLSARAENGALVYTTYGFVWDAEYDPDGLAEMRKLCESRFMNGPEWGAEFFQLYGFPDWAVPCYEIDGVYFSTGKGWQ